jgi:thymidylate synthase (FAD)
VREVKVTLIAATAMRPLAEEIPFRYPNNQGGNWAEDGEALVEFAGRACYQSWSRPNPATATNAGYLRHILDSGHLSVLEHASATFYIEGVSRSLTHELIRHRHLSYSQLSQRYVTAQDGDYVHPPHIAGDPELETIFENAVGYAAASYGDLVEALERKFPDKTRKEIRQAARAVLPNATETKIVVTGNYRAWRHFIAMRATEHADVEIRDLAVEILDQLYRVAPNVFGDFTTRALGDGTFVAYTDTGREV